jgi:hypothetical protein
MPRCLYRRRGNLLNPEQRVQQASSELGETSGVLLPVAHGRLPLEVTELRLRLGGSGSPPARSNFKLILW